MSRYPRLQYSRAFVTEFPDLIVPWKPLSVGEYLKYQQDLDRGIHSLALLEDEIFCKCVLDQSLVRRIKHLKAGIVTIVAGNILQASGDVTAEQFAQDLETARQLTNSFPVIHDLASLILDAYPYKPEEVYEMDYPTLLERAAMAEKKLLRLGVIKEPIGVQSRKEESPPLDRRQQILERRKKGQVAPPPPRVPQEQLLTQQQKKKGKWWKISPVLESQASKTVNTQIEQAEQVVNLSGHELGDLGVQQVLLQKRAQTIYKDLIENFYKTGSNRTKKR